jgi:uncharacterized protein YtpQ (UPF0354 family)
MIGGTEAPMFGWLKKKPAVDASQVVPRIKNDQFRAALVAKGIPAERLPVIEYLVADLSVTYAFDQGSSCVMVMPYHLQDLGIGREALRDLSLTNLKRTMKNAEIQPRGEFRRAVVGNNLDACALLLPDVWTQAAEELPRGLVAMVPSRDMVLFCDAESVEARRAMTEAAATEFAVAGTHALSLNLLRWRKGAWEMEPAKTLPGF